MGPRTLQTTPSTRDRCAMGEILPYPFPETRRIRRRWRALTLALRVQLLPGRLLGHVAHRPPTRVVRVVFLPRNFRPSPFIRPRSIVPSLFPPRAPTRTYMYVETLARRPANDEQRSRRNNESSTKCSRIEDSPVWILTKKYDRARRRSFLFPGNLLERSSVVRKKENGYVAVLFAVIIIYRRSSFARER